jgi:hypothetical protein
VAVTRRVGIDPAAALDLAEMLSLALERQKAAPAAKRVSSQAFAAILAAANNPDAASCAGALDCAAVLGKIGGVDWIYAVQLAKVGPNVIVDATLLKVKGGDTLAAANGPVPFKAPVPALEALAASLVAKAGPLELPPPPPEVPAPAPVVSAPAVVPTVATPAPAAASIMSPGRYAALGLGVLALGAVGGGVYFGVTSLDQSNALSSRAPDYVAKRNQALSSARGADIAYGAAAGLAVVAVVVWVVAGPSSPAPSASGAGGVSGAMWTF